MPERNPNADMRAANQPPVSKSLLAATPLLADAAETISCLLDLIEMYDKRLVQKGDPEHLVYSETHKDGIWKARDVLKRLKSANAEFRRDAGLVAAKCKPVGEPASPATNG